MPPPVPQIGPINKGIGPAQGGMGGQEDGGEHANDAHHAPSHGGRTFFPFPYYPYPLYYQYPTFTTVTERKSVVPFGLQGKALVVGLVLGFFVLPFLVRAFTKR